MCNQNYFSNQLKTKTARLKRKTGFPCYSQGFRTWEIWNPLLIYALIRLNCVFSPLIRGFPLFSDLQTVKTVNSITSNNEGRLYLLGTQIFDYIFWRVRKNRATKIQVLVFIMTYWPRILNFQHINRATLKKTCHACRTLKGKRLRGMQCIAYASKGFNAYNKLF